MLMDKLNPKYNYKLHRCQPKHRPREISCVARSLRRFIPVCGGYPLTLELIHAVVSLKLLARFKIDKVIVAGRAAPAD